MGDRRVIGLTFISAVLAILLAVYGTNCSAIKFGKPLIAPVEVR